MDAPQYLGSWIQMLKLNGSQFMSQLNAPQVLVAMETIRKKIIICNYHVPMIFNCM
jgi:hypothetical protein